MLGDIQATERVQSKDGTLGCTKIVWLAKGVDSSIEVWFLRSKTDRLPVSGLRTQPGPSGEPDAGREYGTQRWATDGRVSSPHAR